MLVKDYLGALPENFEAQKSLQPTLHCMQLLDSRRQLRELKNGLGEWFDAALQSALQGGGSSWKNLGYQLVRSV